MKNNMENFLTLNYGWLLLAVIGLFLVVYAVINFKKPVPELVTTKSANFADDPVVSTPVMANNPHADIFNQAALEAIYNEVNPWIYLRENWEKSKKMNGVEPALIDFIINEAKQKIPYPCSVTLSVREYANPNSIVMEYRDPAKDSIMVTTGHDPEPALYATFANKAESKTFKLVCANGLVRELNPGNTTNFDDDYIIKEGDSFIGLTGETPKQAAKFAEENDLPVRFIVTGKIKSKTPNTSNVKVFQDYTNFSKKSGIFDVVMQPRDILRRKDGKWMYVRQQ